MIGWFKIPGRLPGYNQVISKTRASRYEGARQKQDAESQIGWSIRRAMKEENDPHGSIMDRIPTTEEEINAEVESYRRQLQTQAKMAPSQSAGSDDIAKIS